MSIAVVRTGLRSNYAQQHRPRSPVKTGIHKWDRHSKTAASKGRGKSPSWARERLGQDDFSSRSSVLTGRSGEFASGTRSNTLVASVAVATDSPRRALLSIF